MFRGITANSELKEELKEGKGSICKIYSRMSLARIGIVLAGVEFGLNGPNRGRCEQS